MNENRFEAVQSSLAALKAVHDPAVQAEAKKLEKNINAIIATNKPMVVAYVEQLKVFDASLLAKYGDDKAKEYAKAQKADKVVKESREFVIKDDVGNKTCVLKLNNDTYIKVA